MSIGLAAGSVDVTCVNPQAPANASPPVFTWPLPHRTISPVDDQSPRRGVNTASRPENTCSRAENPLIAVLEETGKLPAPNPGTRSHQNRGAARLLVFLATTDVGRTSGPPVAEEGDGAASEASEWENREREERLALSRED